MKKLIAIMLVLVITVMCVSCQNTPTNVSSDVSEVVSEEKATINVTVLKGPTGLGALRLMEKNDSKTASNNYNFTLASAADEVSAKIINKEADIVAAPTNLAAVLYKRTEGQVVMLAANTLGNLYIVTKNAEISSIADLKGKTIYSSGQGASPEYVLNFLLKENGIDPETDVEIIYKSEHAEVAPVFASEESVIALLPEPFVTNMLLKNSDLKVSVNVTEEWKKVSDSELVMGCLIARKEFVDANPEAVAKFLKEYEESANYAVTNVAETAALSEKYGIMAKNVAEKALPGCNIVYIDGEKMQNYVSAYFEVLFNANPKSVGGQLPDEKLYYKK